MGKEVHHETTIIWRCEGCGKDDIRSYSAATYDAAKLPEGWSALFISEGRDRDFQAEVDTTFQVSTGPYSHYFLKLRPAEPYANPPKQAEPPLPKVLCCHLCKKKLFELFRTKEEPPRAAPAVAVTAYPPCAPFAQGGIGSGARVGDQTVEEPSPLRRRAAWTPWPRLGFFFSWLAMAAPATWLLATEHETAGWLFRTGVGLAILAAAWVVWWTWRPSGK